MDNGGPSVQIVRFGTFEADLQSGELRKSGHKVPLQGQPFQVFAILLKHPGKLVTRDELRLKVWPEDTFVDFDHGLNTAITKIRTALGDDADNPRFVETMPRRGYRFIAPVDSHPQPGIVPVRSSRIQWVMIASLVGVAALAMAGYLYLHRVPKLTDKDTIVLSDFDNKTGDPVFDGTLRQGLTVQLQQSPFLSLVSDQRIQEALRLMEQSGDAKLTPEIAREACQRTGSTTVIDGSIAQIGMRYSLILRAVNCVTGESLTSTEAQASDKNHVLDALGNAASEIRSKLGESLTSVQKFDTPLEQATTSSLEALQAYSLGLKTANAKGSAAALPFFKRTVDLDPNFAMAYAIMSKIYGGLMEVEPATENARKAYELRDKVSQRERFVIEACCTPGGLENAAPLYELWEQTYPRDSQPYNGLWGCYVGIGDWEKASEQARKAVRLEPDHQAGYILLGLSYTVLNRLDEAETVYKQAEERGLAGEELLQNRYLVAFLRSNVAQMAELASAAMGKPGAEDLLLATQADTEGWYGRLKNANELTRRAMDSAQHNDARERAAGYQAAAALREVESGNRKQARAEANAAVKLAPNFLVWEIAALALARAGDTTGAEKLVVEKSFPLDSYWLPTIRAALALERKDPNRAIELLKETSTIELTLPSNFTILLCPPYMRGEAYLMLHDGNRAEMEFQKFIDHRGLVGNFPWGALARLGLARAYALQGDTAKAKAAYQDFLTLWKDADPDIPILIAAKSEYAKLQ
jgi:DNA-binding winged helix-turn-helix (wHTH) protein/tetratricopeptide (TPR) repeat protein